MTRRVDANWKTVQEETMVNWVNSILRGPLKRSDLEVTDLTTDLKDGRALTELLINLSANSSSGKGKQLKLKNQNPKIRLHMIENLGRCFDFMKEENIKLVNIGPEDALDGNVKLMLGLIWTLIRHYQIRSTGKGLSTKQAMLSWVHALIPNRKVTNFTTDWNNGLALCSLVDRLKPGLCPQHATLKPSDGLENCRLGMQLAQEGLDIPQIIKPEHLNHSEVDEMSVMTYISYFCQPSIRQLLVWVQSKIPKQNVTNFKTDWNNGINLAALIEAISPGLFPDWNTLDPHNSLENLTRALNVAEKSLEVEPLLKPEEMADPSVDELNVVTYISRFLNTKAIPLPNNCVASGVGLSKAFVAKEAIFQVNASRAGVGKLDVSISSPSSSKITATVSEEKTGVYKVIYTPSEVGNTSIDIKWGGMTISGSPFTCKVINPGSVSFTGPEITEGRAAKVGKPVIMMAKGVLDMEDLSVSITHSTSGKTVPAQLARGKESGVVECSYTPSSIGKDKVIVKISQEEIPSSPFTVNIVDPTQCRVTHEDSGAGQSVLVGKPTVFTIKGSDANLYGIVVEAKSQKGAVPISTSPSPGGGLIAKYTPQEIGAHTVAVTCAGDNISGSPVSLVVVDPKKVTFLDAIPKYVQIGKQAVLKVSTKGAGSGQLEATSSNQGTITSSLEKTGDDMQVLKLKGQQLGSSDIKVSWSGHDIQPSSFPVHVCDASKCSAYSKSLTSGQGKIEEPFVFSVQAKNAGKGELAVNPSGPKSTYAADIKDNGDGTYNVSFTSYEPGPHKIEIMWGGEHIPNSPYSVNFVKSDANQFAARGEGLNKCIAKQSTQFNLLGPEAGLSKSGVLQVSISGMDLPCSTVPKVPSVSTESKILVSIEDQDGGNYLVSFAVPKGGDYKVTITCAGEHVPGSPFTLHALPAPDASKCKVFGNAIEDPDSLVIGQPLEFKVDVTNAGTGKLSAIAYDSSAKAVPLFSAEQSGKPNEKVHILKIDPQCEGKYSFEIKWADQHIPGSPFKFDVGDPSKVKIVSIPDQESFVAKMGEEFQVVVDTSGAGPGKLVGLMKLSDGSTEPMKITKSLKGHVTCSYTPRVVTHLNLILTYSNVNVLPSPWGVEAVNPNEMRVTPPDGYGRVGQYVSFVITGMSKSNTKKTSIKATHEKHSATIKSELNKDGTNLVRFTPKNIGKYRVEVIYGQHHISGSPFDVLIASPEECKLIDKIPSVIALGKPVNVSLDTSQCGPGNLTASTNGEKCLDYEIGESGKLVLKPARTGTCQLEVKWANYPVAGTPLTVHIVDPSKCTFRCPELQNTSSHKENTEVKLTVDISQCGPCTPTVAASGPKAVYTVQLQDNKDGTFTASFTPWQTGKTKVSVFIAEISVPGSPLEFDVLKQIRPDQITATGDGLTQALSNQSVPVTLHGLDAGSMERGQLTYRMTYSDAKQAKKPPTLQCVDNKNGKHTLTYKAYDIGQYKLSILYEGRDIAGSPFTVAIKPEPRADKCVASGRVIEPGEFLNLKEQAHITVDTTAAGSGNLVVTGRQPDGRVLRVFVNEEESDNRKLKHLIFDAPKVGVYSVGVDWDNTPIPGSPFQVKVVDSSRCIITGDIPDTVQIEQSVTLSIDSTGAGAGSLNVLMNGEKKSALLAADLVELDETDKGKYCINLIGKALGEVTVTIEWGGFPIQKTPFTVNICDTSACVMDIGDVLKNPLQVGVPFQFKVKSERAGKAKLQVKPEQSSQAQYTIDIQSEGTVHTVTCTPWTVGKQVLLVMWGQEPVPNSPFTFTVCDPKKCKIVGLPDSSNYVAVLGEPINFTIDYSEAGPSEPTFVVCLPDGSEEELEGIVEDKVAQYSYLPEEPGRLEFMLEFHHINLLPSPWVCEVPDPSHFRVTPPKGMGQLGEPVKLLITGVTKQTENFSITAVHPNHTASITTEQGKDESTFLAYFTPDAIGDYLVQVKHSSRNIDGSPFTLSVANPAGIKIQEPPADFIKVGTDTSLQIDTTEAGPGDLTCKIVPISGDLEIEPQIISSPDDDGQYEVKLLSEGVGTCQLELRWADYLIAPSPYTICFVDPTKVLVKCGNLESGALINQGDALRFEIGGSEAGHGVPQLTATVDQAPDTAVAVTMEDNKDGTFVATLTPWQSGSYSVSMTWSGFPVPGAAMKFEVHKVIDSRGITAHGDGLKHAVVGEEVTVVINAGEVGLVDKGLLVAKCFNPAEKTDEDSTTELKSTPEEGQETEEEDGEKVKETVIETFLETSPPTSSSAPSIKWKDNKDNTYDLTFLFSHEGQFILSIDYKDQPIYQSPFTISVKGAPSAEKCVVFGPSIDRLKKGLATHLNQQIEIHVDSTEAGNGELQYMASDSAGDTVTVYTHLEETEEQRLHLLKFSPYDVGCYTVKLYWSGQLIPQTPLVLNVVDPTRCLVYGLPLPNNGAVQMGEKISFSIAPSNCGMEVPTVTVMTRSDEEVVENVLRHEVTSAGVYIFEQDTSEPGNYDISVTFGGLHIPGSPFKCDIVDPTQYAICGLSIVGKYAYVGDTVSFQIQGVPSEGESFSVIAHGPNNDQVCTVHGSDGFYDCTFPVVDPGSYEVYVECANKHVPGSPFQINVADPSKCQILELPSELQVGIRESIVIKTSEAGTGELTVLVNDEVNCSMMGVVVEKQNMSTYLVSLEPQYVGEVKLDLLWAERTIPQFPVQLNICDASQCKVFGQALVSKRGKVGEPIVFTVVTNRAGTSKLTIKATGPSASYTVTPTDVGENKYEAQFTPWQVGPHTIEIFWGRAQVKKSPFSLHIDKSTSSDATCHATGEGLKKAIAGKPAQFMLFSSETGLVEKGALKVSVKSALHGENINLKVKDENNGSYEVTYLPPSRGAFLATVTFYDEPIPGSPFKINCVAGPDASKCHVDGLHQNTLYIAGKPVEFTVDCSEAGFGQLRVYVQGPKDQHPKVYLADNGKGIHSVKFDTMSPGRYFIVVAWSEAHIPGSPFKIRVHPGPNASKVKVTGPGTQDSFLGENNELYIDTKEAGIGTLLIRVHGIKDAFKIQADPINESEPRVLLASYSPKIPGSYDIFIRWSGVHVPGSPFKVRIRKPSDPKDDNEEVVAKPVRKAPSSERTSLRVQRQRRIDVSTDEEDEPRRKPERRKKTSSVGAAERKQLGMAPRGYGQAEQRGPRVLPRSMSVGVGVGPIKPHMKMKKNPSFGQIQPVGMPGRPQYFYQPGGMMMMSAQPVVHKKVVVEKKMTKRHSRLEERGATSIQEETRKKEKVPFVKKESIKEEIDATDTKPQQQKKKKRRFELS